MSFRRHGEIFPCDKDTTLRAVPCSSPWTSLQLVIPGGVLSSRARVRFTSRRDYPTQRPRLSIQTESAVNCGSTDCLNPGVHFIFGRCGSVDFALALVLGFD